MDWGWIIFFGMVAGVLLYGYTQRNEPFVETDDFGNPIAEKDSKINQENWLMSTVIGILVFLQFKD